MDKVTKRKMRIEKAKTWALIALIAFALGVAVGFRTNDTLQAKYTKVQTVSQNDSQSK
jgi:hypothetical protein